ncbi:MAG TPA: S41 family peptidase [Chloroflexi bacterium]|nr:S41 family peptidase [Chloroflexota bacterium]
MANSDRERERRPVRNFIVAVLGLTLAGLIFVAGVATGASLDVAGTVGFFPPSALPVPAAGVPDEETADEFKVFWEVWNTIEDRFYYDLPDRRTRIYGAINGMLETLDDPYTAFVPPEVARILREDNSGEFEGIGAYVEEAPDGGVFIIRVFEDGPAAQAGLRAGDIVVAVDGQDITRATLNEALLLIRGPAGTDVTLTVVREGEDQLLEFTITRARLEIPTVEARMLDDNIGYVALFEFNSVASRRLTDAVEELLDQGAEAIILDLRNNPGGFLDQAIDVADLFLPEGVVVIQRDVDGNERIHRSRDGQIAEDVPLVVLVNEGSASASEIVAGAIQDRGRGTLIGETTFGKGSVQLQFDLSDGSQLRVTYANWYTPNDRSISEEGITPDIIVETPTEPSEEDPQLERAIQYLETGQ